VTIEAQQQQPPHQPTSLQALKPLEFSRGPTLADCLFWAQKRAVIFAQKKIMTQITRVPESSGSNGSRLVPRSGTAFLVAPDLIADNCVAARARQRLAQLRCATDKTKYVVGSPKHKKSGAIVDYALSSHPQSDHELVLAVKPCTGWSRCLMTSSCRQVAPGLVHTEAREFQIPPAVQARDLTRCRDGTSAHSHHNHETAASSGTKRRHALATTSW
jgi:hypothetical protein